MKILFAHVCGLLLVVVMNSSRANAVNYCSNHAIADPRARSSGRSFMQFTKETVNQEYGVEGQFKALHCCAKGYRSIEWFKDGKRYPWSSDDTSSLILYPQAANQTIYARHASKVDEGRYTCVLRNDTHKIEHQMQLKVLDSSPDVPLATFTPGNQFADVGGSARFFCEAFVGKKDLPDIIISIKWYHMSDDNQDRLINDELQEIVKREEEQIIGSYLHIPQVTMNHYGRYLCRVEMGNSQTHRLEMSAELINALPIKADRGNFFLNPYFLATCAALITISLFFLALHTQRWWNRHLIMIFNMKTVNPDTPHKITRDMKIAAYSKQNIHNSNDESKVMIEVV